MAHHVKLRNDAVYRVGTVWNQAVFLFWCNFGATAREGTKVVATSGNARFSH